MALRRVWGAERTVVVADQRCCTAFPTRRRSTQRMRENQLDYLASSEHAQASLAEQYVGLPFEA